MKRIPNAVRLEFETDRQVQANLSGVAFSGKRLWVAGDEASSVDLLEPLPAFGDEHFRFGGGREFALSELLDLPGDPGEEADVEGLAVADGWLWVAGSHGVKRRRAKPGLAGTRNAKRLAKVRLDANRRLLARIPIEIGSDGSPSLVRQAADGRRAARLRGDEQANTLTAHLADDPHVGRFMAIPGKDNGFDIEGIALRGERVLLGLRGPVLRGWSIMLEIAVSESDGVLDLSPLDDNGLMLRKHFLSLEGLGIRDLHFSDDDLYLLAGPTMVLDGDIRLYDWKQASATFATCSGPATFHHDVAESITLPHSRGHDRAEAICRLPPEIDPGEQTWLVLYDSPGPQRREAGGTVFGDLLVTENEQPEIHSP